MTPYFSIIIPLYNKENHIKTSINSVLKQVVKDFEIIVINDGSTDNSAEIVKAFEDQRILLFNIENKGVSHARNYGITKASSDKIVFLDADDYWESFHLKDLKQLYETFPGCGMYCKAYSKQKGEILIPSKFKNISNQHNWSGIVTNYFESSLINSIAWTSAVMIPKQVLKTLDGFNETYNSGEDTDLWIRIALQYPIAFSNKISATHNLNADNKMTNTKLISRKHLDFDVYEKEAISNKSLKQYLDINRLSMAIQYRLEGNNKLATSIYKKIDYNNLSLLQKLVVKSPTSLLKGALKLREFFRKLNINLRLFR